MEIIIAIVKLALLAAVVVGGLAVGAMVIGMAFLFHRVAFSKHEPGQCRSGWKRVLVPFGLVLVVAWLVARSSYRHDAHEQVQAAKAKRAMAIATAEQQCDVALAEAKQQVKRDEKSMQELWEELNKPRINLNVDERADTSESHDPRMDMSSLDGAAERLEGVAEKVSTAARQASDVGTIIGKTLVALQRLSDQPTANAAPSEAADAPSAGEVAVAAAVAAEVPAPTPAPRPEWIDDPPKRVGNVWRVIVVAGDFATREECDREADRLLIQATAEHLADITGMQRFENVAPSSDAWNARLGQMDLGLDYIRREMAKDEYEETVDMSVGPMKRLYTLVEFSPGVDAELRARWQTYLQRQRLSVVGFGAGSVLGLIGLAYGLLKVDTWTKGYYTKRLFLGATAGIIGFILLLTWNEVIF